MNDILKMYIPRDAYVASMAALRIAIERLPTDDKSRNEFEAALLNMRDAFHNAIRRDFIEKHRGNATPALLRPQAD